ncbi:MAG: MBG domain-containing protein, partial [Lentisphaeria bacterium]|nr:MBG domain-containing protein [Lentisphaeria bacterium]
MASWRQDERAGEDDLWSVEWLATGPATPCLEAAMTGPAAEYWRTFTLSRTLTVKPRPLVVAADDLEYTYGDDFPALTWSIVGGRLADGDAVTGNLTCAYAGVLDQTYAITPGTLRVEDGAGGANYRMEFWPGILICHKAIAAMTVTGNEHVYNGAPADFTWTTDPPGLAGVITCTGLDGTAYGPAPELPVAAGTYLVTVQVDDPHYRGQVESNLRIHKATLTVSAAHCTRMFGVANPDFQLTYTGFRGSDGPEALAPPLTTCMAEPGSPVGNYAITLSGGQADNYDLQLLPGTLTITPAPVLASVTVAPATYGDRLEDLAASAAAAHAVTGAPVPGTLRWVDAGDTVLAAGEHACDWTFLPDDANHAAVTSTAMVVVAKAPLAVQAPRLERGAGTENPAMTLAYSGFVQDEDEHTPGVFVRAPTLACAASADSPAGLYPIQILPGEAVNYEMTYLDGWLQVCLALPQVDSMIAMEATYGTFLQDIVLTGSFQHPVTGAAVSGTLSWEDGQELPPAGTHVRPWRFVPDDGDRYAPVCGVAEVVVHPRRLVIAAGSDSKNYGEDDPPFTWEFTPSSMPLVDGDAIDVHVRRTAGEMPGQYELWPEIAAPDGNYTVELLPGTLTIRRLPIAVWADSRFKPFGEPDPALTYKVTQGALLEGDAFSGSLEREAGEERGSYAIHQGTLSLPEYYLITFKSSQLSILTRQLTVSFTPWSKVYGEPDPDWNCSITVGSLLPGDALAGSPGRHPGEAVGQYAVHAGDLRVNDNYTLSFRPGAVAILPRAITVQAHDLWRFPRMPNPPFTYEITEGAIVDGTSFTGELSCPQTTLLGTHEIKQGTLALNDNYVLTYRPGVLEVVSPVITNWEAAATELTYGQKLADAGLAGAFLHPRTGEPVPGTLQWELPETMPNPGVRMHAAQFLPEPLTWLDPVKLAVSVTVHRIRLKVVAQSYDIIWGDMIGDGTGFKYEITEGALLPGDTPSGNVSCVNTGHVGVYPISMGSLRFPSHYDVEFVPGTLTIRHRHLTVQADDMSKIMNHTDPVYTYTIIDGSLAGNAFFAGIMMREAGETPGTYRMMLGTFKVSTADCILHFVEGTFTILPTPEPRVVYATSIYVGEPLSCSTLRGVMGFNDTATRGHQAAILTWATPDERLPAGTWSREWLYVDDAGIIDRGMCNVRVIPLRVTVAPRPSTRPIRGAAQDDSAAGSEASGWGVDLFASLEEALAAVAPNGKVLVEPGEYLAPAQGWFIDKNVTITGGQDTPPLNPDPQAPPERQPEPNPQAPPSPEAVLLVEVIIAGEDTTTVTISGLTILAQTGAAA